MVQHDGFNDEQGTRRAVEPTGVQSDAIASQGRVTERSRAGTTPSHDRPSYRDPVADNTDPTDPDSPEQTLAYQHDNSQAAPLLDPENPHQNLIDGSREDLGRA